MSFRTIICCALLGALLGGCTATEKKTLGSPFLISKSQGVKKGQSKSEVLSILGAPWSIEPDTEHPGRELYIYKSRESEQHTVFFPPILVLWKKSWFDKFDERRLTVGFENNRIVDMKYEVWGETKLDKPSAGPEGKMPLPLHP